MDHWAVVAACGPDDREIERVRDLLESVFHYEPQTRWVAVIDSATQDRNLAARFQKPDGATIVGIRNPKCGWADGQWGPLCVGVLAAYEWIVKQTDARFVVKFDSDALVIAPFAAQIQRAMREHPNAAIFGSYRVDCNGVPRDIRGMAGLMRRLHKLALLEYQPKRFGRKFPLALRGRPARMRRHIGHALRNGYEFGEHVSGGAYAATRELLNRMAEHNYIGQRHCWADSQMSEDVMMGMYARACRLELAAHAANGDAFGVKHIGLPDTPPRLLERGYSIIHSVKSDPRYSEQQVRSFYQQIRAGADLATATAALTQAPEPQLVAAAAPATAAADKAHPEDYDDLDEMALSY